LQRWGIFKLTNLLFIKIAQPIFTSVMKRKILYIHQFFKTPSEGGITRSYDIAKELLRYNNSITIITSWNNQSQKTVMIDGIKVIYLPVEYHNEFGFSNRVKSFYKFQKKAIRVGKALDIPDLIYATSTPLNVGWVGKTLSRYFNKPWIFEVRDLWPEAPIQVGAVKNSFLKTVLYHIEKKLYKSADKLIALSPVMQQYIWGKTQKPSTLIPNLSNNDRFDYCHTPIQNKFIVGYFGAISHANGLDRLLDVAKYVDKHGLSQFEFRVFGEGQSLEELQLKSKDLNNITFYGKKSKTDLVNQINQCHASYISFLEIPILESCSPNKFFDSLASGKLIISNTKGWLKDLIENNACGVYTPTPEEFVKKVTPYTLHEESLIRAQKNAKNLALNNFDRKKLVKRINELVVACTSHS